MDAIGLCIELGIPLKEFNKYYDSATGQLKYDKLFNDGTSQAEIKFKQITNRLDRLKNMQNEIVRGENVCKISGITKCVLPAVSLWIKPININNSAYSDKATQLNCF